MVRYQITDDDDEWDFVVHDEHSSLVPFVEEDKDETRQRLGRSVGKPRSPGIVSLEEEENVLGPIGRYYYAEEDTRRSHCGIFRLSILIGLLGILVQAYLPPAPPPLNNNHLQNDIEGEDAELSSWNSYLQSHSQQWLDSTKALMIDTPWHIVSWLGIAAFRDVQHFATTASTPTDCSWKIPSSMETIQQDLLRVIVGQDMAVSLIAEALVAWTASETQREPLKILSLGPKSTGKRSLANIIASYAPCEKSILYIPKNDPSSRFQKSHRMQQHVQQYDTASMIIFHDDDELYDITLENADHAILYRISETHGRSIMAHGLRTHTWGSASMMADLRRELQWNSQILPFAPMTPESLGKIIQKHGVREDEGSLLEHVEYMDWTTKDGSLILRIAIEGAQSLPWNRIRARKVYDKTSSPRDV